VTILDWLGAASIVLGGFLALAGWLSGRDNRTANDGEWRGSVNTMLKTIHDDIGGVSGDVKCVQNTLNEHGAILSNHEARIINIEKSK